MRVVHFIAVSGACVIAAGTAAADDAAQPSNPLPAQTTAPTTVQVTAPAQAQASDANKLICHQMVYDGMPVGRPQCMTAHQWEARQATRQRELQQLQIRASTHRG